MSRIKSFFISSIVAGALILPFSQQVKADNNMPPAHYGIEEIVDYNPSRGCDVGVRLSQSEGHRPQGVRISDDTVMTETVGLQCRYFQLFTSRDRIEGSGRYSNSFLLRVVMPELSWDNDKESFARIFVGYGKTEYKGVDGPNKQLHFGLQGKGFPGAFPLDINFIGYGNIVEGNGSVRGKGDSDYFVLTGRHDFEMTDRLKIPATVGIERYAITPSDDAERKRQNEVFGDAGLKYTLKKDDASLVFKLNHRVYLNEEPLTKVGVSFSHNFK